MKKVNKLTDLIFKSTKKSSKLLLQASCAVIFIALFCNSKSDPTGCADCGDDLHMDAYVVDVAVVNRSNTVITVYIFDAGYADILPGETRILTKKVMDGIKDKPSCHFEVLAYVGPYIKDVTPLLGKKEVLVTEFEKRKGEHSPSSVQQEYYYAECFVIYPW